MNLPGLPAPGLAVPPCGHPDGCDQPATHQYQRPATPDEAEAHWSGLEQNIRASNSGKPEADYVADRTDTVVVAEHRCDNPEHADPAYLGANIAASAYTSAMNQLQHTVAPFTAEQIQQLADSIRQIAGTPS